MRKALPAILVLTGVGIGMMAGALANHLPVGAFAGLVLGFIVGAAVLVRDRRRNR